MGDSNLTKLTASLEELSLKKQLPLRQTTQKPVLKYNQPLAKPVQLFNHENIVNVNGQDGRNSYSSLSQASSNAPMVPAPFRITRNPNPSFNGNRGGGQTYISPNNVGKPPNPTPKSHNNPYARPLSAKDIVSDLLNQSTQVKKTVSSANTSSPMTGSASSISSNNSTGMSFPVNSFMRPQSAVRKETIKTTKESPRKDTKGHTAKTNMASENKGTSQRTNPNVDGENAKNRTTISHMTQMTVTQQGDQVITTRQGANGVTVIQKVAAPPNFGTQINSIITKVTDSKANGQTSSNNKVTTKQVSSIPKPGLKTSSPASSTTSSESAGKIRNLNYTPTKPYEDVKDPTQKRSPEKENKATTEPKGILKSQQTISTAISNLEEKMKTSPSTVILSQLKETVAQNLNSNGTSYYRKGSKSEIMIHEQRPPVVGAPSKVSKGMEKLNLVEDEEYGEDDDEEETDSGPGERLPGDGEASLEGDYGDDDDDGIDNLDDDCVDDSEGESDGYSITSSLSRRSSSAKSRAKSASARRPTTSRSVSTASTDEVRPKTVRPATAIPDKTIKPPLKTSLFPNIPPTVNFAMEGEKVEQLPWDIRKLLKWRMSPITPNIVKQTLARSGFRITKRNHDWLGCWGKHMKSQGFKSIREYQKLNHFPGSFQIGRKDRLWRNLSKMQLHFGKKEFGFFPQTFVLPFDMKLLKRSWEDGGNKQKWIIKPPASARGIGIKVIHKWNQIPRKRPVIVQRYLGRPYLINDSKFDMRIYVYVSSYDPLRVYVFEDGLARFASCKYSSAMKSINNKFMHLTNYSVNKKNSEYQANGDDSVCQGHKWGLKALWNYMKRQGINTVAIWESIKDLVIKTIICAESPINSMIKANCRSRYCVHELFGFDVLLDENLKPWILEVNISPSLHSNSQLDVNIKGQMIRDLLNISGFHIPDKADVNHSNSAAPNAAEFSTYRPPNDYCMDKRLFTSMISPDERVKHAYYSQRHQDEQVLQTILDVLTPDDIRVLTQSIDEDSRKGGFQRVFPTPSTHKYLRFFEAPRYYNILLDQWVQRYNHMERKGIALLEAYCEDCVHLENPTDNPTHQWCPPNSSLLSHRGEPRTHSAPNTNKHGDIIKHSHSTSQIPKVAKKPPKAPSTHHSQQHYHAATSNRTISQCSSSTSVTPSVPESPVPQLSKPSGAVSSR